MKRALTVLAAFSLVAGVALSAAPVAADPIPVTKAKSSFPGNGTYRVGKDIKPGTYVARPSGSISGYWERLSCATGDFDCILANDNVSGQTFVTILSSDKYFSTTRMGTWQLARKVKPRKPATSFAGSGMYRVGVDIKPGTYVSQPSGSISGYWERLSCATGDFDCILANDNVNGRTYVRILPTDKYFSTTRMGTWKKR